MDFLLRGQHIIVLQLTRKENRRFREKNPRGKNENQQQTQPTFAWVSLA